MKLYSRIVLTDSLPPLDWHLSSRSRPTELQVLRIEDGHGNLLARALRFTRSKEFSPVSPRLYLLDDLAQEIERQCGDNFYGKDLHGFTSFGADGRTTKSLAGFIRRFLHRIGCAEEGPLLGDSSVPSSIIFANRFRRWVATLDSESRARRRAVDPAHLTYRLRRYLGIESEDD
ncbi:hypothetical protein GC173_14805 [bacterium]|nr:hypothetical protein [bacterium]